MNDKFTNICVTLDSIIDTRWHLYDVEISQYRNRLLDTEKELELYRLRDNSFLKNPKKTNIERLLMVLKSRVNTFSEHVLQNNKAFNIVINTYPYILSREESVNLYKGFKLSYTFADDLKVVCEEPTANNFSTYDVVVDYDGLFNLDNMIKEIYDEDLQSLHNLTNTLDDTTLIVPSILQDAEIANKVVKNGSGPLTFFKQMMKEYTPLIRLEVVDLNFFNLKD